EDTLIRPGRGYLATLCFSIIDTGIVNIDSVFFIPNNHLTFVTTQPKGYTPVFTKAVLPIISYLPGDTDRDFDLDVSDVIYLVNYLFKGGLIPYPKIAGDVNGDCRLDITDAIYLINYLFKGGPLPVPGCDF
ncbi:MAG: dockerin type I domain-containing protein, partial [candidate division Zixibacteria bacterium]|nr:dockerin type I domain-containing protein [candidate division Zixibacteria bacterium]